MEQHPVPQNVTTFQFRLIGDMTIRQFGYLAGGAILAYISYKLPLPFFFSWPLAFVFALGGIGLAFVPIEDRPMDIWVLSFLKNVYSPTQFIWAHETQTPAAPAAKPAPAQVVSSPTTIKPAAARPVSDVLQQIYSPLEKSTPAKPGFFLWLASALSPRHTPAAPPPSPAAAAVPMATPSVTGNHPHFDMTPPPKVTPKATKEQRVPDESQKKSQKELNEKVFKLQEALNEKTQSGTRILELQKQLTEVLAEKEHLSGELARLRRQTTAIATPEAPRQPTVRIITPETAVKAGLPRLTTFPNIVTGVIRDADNNLLPGVLVTVKDKEGVPLRALKTNRLGQFAASTPIPNGTYLVEIEDPRVRFIFDRVQVTLNGSIVPALEIFAKSHKQVAREKLAKEIFGT